MANSNYEKKVNILSTISCLTVNMSVLMIIFLNMCLCCFTVEGTNVGKINFLILQSYTVFSSVFMTDIDGSKIKEDINSLIHQLALNVTSVDVLVKGANLSIVSSQGIVIKLCFVTIFLLSFLCHLINNLRK